MVILDVIPLIPLPRHSPAIASYFHSEALPRGAIVQVSFSNRNTKAVVVASAPLAERKLQFKKQSTFTLKKIDKVLKKRVTDENIKKAHELSEYYFAPLGICMRAVMLHPDEKNYKKYISRGPVVDLSEVVLKNTTNIKLIDMRKEIRDANYSIFSRDLKNALQQGEQVIIFIPRRGFANFLLCKDCGHAITCPNCSASLAVYDDKLQCHHCDFSQPRPKQCPKCKSYNFKTYGVGIEKVESELLKFFHYQNLTAPKIAKLTSDSKKLPKEWDILLATQSIFKYKDLLKVKFLAIINADTLIHIPDYDAEERLLRQTLLLASMTQRLLVQTYNPEDPALLATATGTVDAFMERELAHRKQFGYPPFAKLIKLTYRHREARIAERIARDVAEKCKATAYPALIFRERGRYIWNVLIKNPSDATRYALHDLPSDWEIDVDPVSIA